MTAAARFCLGALLKLLLLCSFLPTYPLLDEIRASTIVVMSQHHCESNESYAFPADVAVAWLRLCVWSHVRRDRGPSHEKIRRGGGARREKLRGGVTDCGAVVLATWDAMAKRKARKPIPLVSGTHNQHR